MIDTPEFFPDNEISCSAETTGNIVSTEQSEHLVLRGVQPNMEPDTNPHFESSERESGCYDYIMDQGICGMALYIIHERRFILSK